MSEPQDLATAIAIEVAKQLPVKEAYSDVLSPGLKETGRFVEDMTKTLRLVLAPLQVTAALQDRFSKFLDQAIRNVPETRRVAPPPQILGPVLEAIRYEPPGTPISQMFEELVSRASDQVRAHEAHPWYPLLIRQLSSDEAILLGVIQSGASNRHLARRCSMDLDPQASKFLNFVVHSDDLPTASLQFPDNVDFYIEHLWSIGLAGRFKIEEAATFAPDDGHTQVGTSFVEEYRLTSMGSKFMAAVRPAGTE